MNNALSLPVWPVELGAPLRAGYGHSLSIAARTESNLYGPARMRRTAMKKPAEFTVVFLWSSEQLDQFRQFAREQLKSISGWFELPLKSGGEISPHRVRILSLSKYDYQAPDWQVSMTLECRDRFVLPDHIGEILLCWKAADLQRSGTRCDKSMCYLSSLLRCFGSWNVFDISQTTNENLCRLTEIASECDD